MTTLRNWHRWLAVLIGAFVLFQGFTGAVSQQRFFLLAASEPDIYAVARITEKLLSPAEILASVAAAKPGFRPAHVMLPMSNSPGTAAIVMGGRKPMGMDMSVTVTVDQYSGAIIAERSSADGWVGAITGLHKWANYGVSGRVFLAVMGLATTTFMLSGLAMWWQSRAFAGRLQGLQRWHRRAGLIVSILLVCVSLTGVTLNLVTWQEKQSGVSVVSSNMRAGMAGGPPAGDVIGLAAAWDAAVEAIGPQRLAAFSNIGPHAAQYWFAFTDAQLRRTDVLVEPVTGAASVYRAGILVGGEGLRSWLLSLHTGYIIGRTGGLVMTIVGCSLVFWAVSGFMIWRRRVRVPVR